MSNKEKILSMCVMLIGAITCDACVAAVVSSIIARQDRLSGRMRRIHDAWKKRMSMSGDGFDNDSGVHSNVNGNMSMDSSIDSDKFKNNLKNDMNNNNNISIDTHTHTNTHESFNSKLNKYMKYIRDDMKYCIEGDDLCQLSAAHRCELAAAGSWPALATITRLERLCTNSALKVCMHVCMFVCLYVCMFVCLYVFMYVMYVCMHIL